MFSTIKGAFTSTQSESCDTDGGGCCSAQPKGKEECPECGVKAKGVLAKTVEALVKEEAKAKLECLDGFHYCKTPSCSVVYFRDETLLTQVDMRVSVGLKEGATPATLCYCFEWTKEKIKEELQRDGETIALDDIKAKMKNPGCSCEVLNPSGGCCLGDVTKAIKELKAEL